MDAILAKLSAAGIPADVISALQEKFGDTLGTELATNGLGTVVSKLGLDTSSLPDVDFGDLLGAFSEFRGVDADGDGKTGIMEAVEGIQNSLKGDNNTDTSSASAAPADTGILGKLLGFLGK